MSKPKCRLCRGWGRLDSFSYFDTKDCPDCGGTGNWTPRKFTDSVQIKYVHIKYSQLAPSTGYGSDKLTHTVSMEKGSHVLSALKNGHGELVLVVAAPDTPDNEERHFVTTGHHRLFLKDDWMFVGAVQEKRGSTLVFEVTDPKMVRIERPA